MFAQLVEALTDSKINRSTRVEVLANGEVFYQAMLDAIGQAQRSVNIEAYIFQRGKVTRAFIAALAERARAGVKVNVVLDGIGSFLTFLRYFKELTNAGGRVNWYHGFRWYTLPRLNNRTHREILVVDGTVGFLGGAGFADHWLVDKGKNQRWRDTMFRVEGDAEITLQGAFTENWLETSGEVLTGEEYFPLRQEQPQAVETASSVLIVKSAPSAGRSTRARTLYQTLLASARQAIEITTPYFLPDRGTRDELIRAVRERGVEVRILAPGQHADHLLTRRSSRRLYGQLLAAGVKIFEYQPAMIHAKSLVVDRMWCVVGSTNFDHRSFGLNDEVNLAACDEGLATRLHQDFALDLAQSRAITYDDWRRRPLWERIHESLGWILERQE